MEEVAMEGTLAERLGFAAGERVVVIHVDDIGMCHAANEGAFEALANGPATCGSVMVPCPWFPEAAERARRDPGVDLGVHLTLTAEWERYRWGPVLGRSRVPSLCDAEGCLPRTVLEVLKQAKPEEVELELRAQIELALERGIDVTHLDAHMGTAYCPPYHDLLLRLAADYRLPVMAPPAHPDRLAPSFLQQATHLFAPLADRLRAAGLPVVDAFDADSLDFAPDGGPAHQAKRLARVGPGVSWVLCHAAKGGDELTAVTPQGAHAREFERTFYGGEAGRRAFAEAGIHTLGTRALRDLVRDRG